MIFKLLDSSMKVDNISEATIEALTELIEGQADTFKNATATFDEALEFEEGTCTITVRYTDPDDNVIAEQTFAND